MKRCRKVSYYFSQYVFVCHQEGKLHAPRLHRALCWRATSMGARGLKVQRITCAESCNSFNTHYVGWTDCFSTLMVSYVLSRYFLFIFFCRRQFTFSPPYTITMSLIAQSLRRLPLLLFFKTFGKTLGEQNLSKQNILIDHELMVWGGD